jgi:3-methyladenine DNA glycosylase AlkD
VPLNSRARGGQGDTARTLRVCAALVDDRDDMVVKALSWALRELSKRDPQSVARFLREHESNLAPRVRREVRTKLETGRKVAPRRARSTRRLSA